MSIAKRINIKVDITNGLQVANEVNLCNYEVLFLFDLHTPYYNSSLHCQGAKRETLSLLLVHDRGLDDIPDLLLVKQRVIEFISDASK